MRLPSTLLPSSQDCSSMEAASRDSLALVTAHWQIKSLYCTGLWLNEFCCCTIPIQTSTIQHQLTRGWQSSCQMPTHTIEYPLLQVHTLAQGHNGYTLFQSVYPIIQCTPITILPSIIKYGPYYKVYLLLQWVPLSQVYPLVQRLTPITTKYIPITKP